MSLSGLDMTHGIGGQNQMKYGKLIDFHPIEDVIQLKSADDVATGRGSV